MKRIWLLTLLWQGLFSPMAAMPAFMPAKVQEDGRQIRQALMELEQKQKTLAGIVDHICRKQQANTASLKQAETTQAFLQEKTTLLMRKAQTANLSQSGSMALDQYQKDLQKVQEKKQRLETHQTLLETAKQEYTARLETTQQEWTDLEKKNREMLETSGILEMKPGGTPNLEAVIPSDANLPVYQPLPADAEKQAEKASIQEAAEQESAGAASQSDEAGHTSNGERKDTAASIGSAHAGGSSPLETNGRDPNTGSVRNGPSFFKACPAETMDFADFDGTLDIESGSFIVPVNGVVSGGTWAYYGGGMHLGLDLAAPMFTAVRAPAAGVVVYADTPVDSNCGYLGNYCGWPYGGGNTLCLLCVVNGKVYAITFAHLSSTIYVSPGQQVKQSDIIALSGNSGNSTGPHTHIEVFALSVSLEEAVRYFSYGADFAFGCGWDAPATCSGYGCRIRPESVFF